MLFAIIRKTNQPIKLTTWEYDIPGHLATVKDESGKPWNPSLLIPIGYKRYRKMQDDIAKRKLKKQFLADDALSVDDALVVAGLAMLIKKE